MEIDLSKLSKEKLVFLDKKLLYAIKHFEKKSRKFNETTRLIIFRNKLKIYLDKRDKNEIDLVDAIVTYGY